MIELDCPRCEKHLRIPDTFAGQMGKCKGCGMYINVPAARAPLPPAPPVVPPAVPGPAMRRSVDPSAGSDAHEAQLPLADIHTPFDLAALQAGAGYLNFQRSARIWIMAALGCAAAVCVFYGFLVGKAQGAAMGFTAGLLMTLVPLPIGLLALWRPRKWRMILFSFILLLLAWTPLYVDATLNAAGLTLHFEVMPFWMHFACDALVLGCVICFAIFALKHRNYRQVPSKETLKEVARLRETVTLSPDAITLWVIKKEKDKEELQGAWRGLLTRHFCVFAKFKGKVLEDLKPAGVCCFASREQATVFVDQSHRGSDEALVPCIIHLPGKAVGGSMAAASLALLGRWMGKQGKDPDQPVIRQLQDEWWPAEKTRYSKAAIAALFVNGALIAAMIWLSFPYLSLIIGGRLAAGEDGKDKNPEGSVVWFDRAARFGSIDFQKAVASSYLKGDNGFGIPKKPEKAVQLFSRLAEQGDAQSQAVLGICYGTGEGVSKNKVEAAKWLRKAAAQGIADAQAALDALESDDGAEEGVEEPVEETESDDGSMADADGLESLRAQATSLYGVGMDLGKQGQWDQALSTFEEARSVAERLAAATPADRLMAEIDNNIAYALISRQNPTPPDLDRALKMAEESVRLSMEDPNFVDTLAAVYFARGATQKAVHYQKKAIRNLSLSIPGVDTLAGAEGKSVDQRRIGFEDRLQKYESALGGGK